MPWLMQVEVTTGDGPELTTRVCWIDRKVKVGNIIRFKHDTNMWTVTEVYDQLSYTQFAGYGWNNNI